MNWGPFEGGEARELLYPLIDVYERPALKSSMWRGMRRKKQRGGRKSG